VNLYAVLGVKRDASADDVERAYRRLARRYHPGVNPGDRVAEDRYHQIRRAYGVLGDPARRRDYDRRGDREPVADVQATVSFEGFDFSAPADGPLAATFSELFADVFHDAAREATTPTSAGDVEARLSLDFEAAVRGGAFPLSVTRRERCPHCAGMGRVPRPAATCPACSGLGSRRWARGHMVFMKPCDTCAGEGRVAEQACRPCRAVGVQARTEVVTVAVPPGVDTGARLAVPGRGHAAARGGPVGDLYVTVDVSPHRFFTRVDRDLHLVLPLAVHEAALGARIAVPTLDGPVKLRVPPGTASGQRLRLRHRGVPGPAGDERGAGDLVAEIQIVLPAVRDARSKALLKEFGELNDDDVRAHLFVTGSTK
jgi:molecular chaperone DnaJ